MNNIKPIVGTEPDLAHPRSHDVVSDWLFNEGVGSQLGDSFPGRNHGKIIGATWGPGGLSFDAPSGNWVDLGLSTLGDAVHGAPAITVMMSVNLSGVFAGANPRIFNLRNQAADGFAILPRDRPGNTFSILVLGRSIAGEGSETQTTADKYEYNTWHRIVGVCDFANDNLLIYVNGEKEIDAAVTWASSTYIQGNADMNDALMSESGGATNFSGGLVDNVIVYKKAVSMDDVLQDFLDNHAMFEQAFDPAIFGTVAAANVGALFNAGLMEREILFQ